MPGRLGWVLTVLALTPVVAAAVLQGNGRASAPRAVSTNATFFNDATMSAADPFVLQDDASGFYYAYSTDGADPGYHFAIYRSPDLATWERLPGGALEASGQHWGRDWFWAPEVYHNRDTGLYFLFYSARLREDIAGHFRYADFEEPSKIGVAVSRSPAGPFRDVVNRPIDYYPYDPDYHDVNLIMDELQKKPPDSLAEGMRAPLGTYLPFIDPSVFFDDGRIYLYYSRNAYRNWVWDHDLRKYIEEANIYAVELTSDWWHDPTGTTMPAIAARYRDANRVPGDPPGTRRDGFTRILSYGADPQPWENAHVNDYEQSGGEFKDRRWEEGSTTVRMRTSNGRPVYFLLYSANNYASPFYGVGYAVAEHPMGPWHKNFANPVLEQDEQIGMYSTGHGSVISSPDGSELYYVHHGRPETGTNRRLYTARLEFDPDNTALTIGQSVGDQPIPSGVAPYTLRPDARLVRLDEGVGRLGWTVVSAQGAAMDLSHSQNRVALALEPAASLDVEKAPDHAVLTGSLTGVATLTLRYQRLPAQGEFFDVDNVFDAGTEREQHRPVSATVPIAHCTEEITGVHEGDLVVSAGTVCLRNATVRGEVRVIANASLVAVDSDIRAAVDTSGADTVWLLGSRVHEDVVIRNSGRIVRVDTTTINGSVILAGNRRPVLTDSRVDGSLTCLDNAGKPTDEGRPNFIRGTASGQCAQLGRGF